MIRRTFLKNAGLAALAGTLPPPFKGSMYAHPQQHQFEMEECTISSLQQQMNSGTLSAVAITNWYLQRVSAIDQAGSKLNSVIEINPDAVNIAQQMDEERRQGRVRSLLHGVPVLIKDNIDTGDKMMTSAGSLALLNNYAQSDAFIVKQLRAAGAVLLGKTNLSEWANFRSYHSASGWSSRGGQTRNACVIDRNPSGSSSGSAVAVAANLCTVAVGTETNGSIISPSSHNGIVGLKPTVGLWSRSGIIPISATQDTAGPMTRTVADAAVLLGALSVPDVMDEATSSNKSPQVDYTRYLDKNALRGKKIGVEKSVLTGRQSVVDLFKAAIATMQQQGANVVEIELLKPFGELKYQAFQLLLYEFKDGINKYLQRTSGNIKTLQQLINFNNANRETMIPYFGQEIFDAAEKKNSLMSNDYKNILAKQKDVRKLINDLMEENKLHCICGITAGVPGLIDVVNGDYDTGFYFGTPAATAGYPHITVPMGKIHELPVGLSFMSSAYSEGELISIAYSYEQASLKREAARFLPGSIPS